MNPKLHELLASKSTPTPSPEYFRGVMTEFHRRQRAELLKPRFSLLTWFKTWEERLASHLFPNPQATWAAVAAIALVVGGIGFGIQSGVSSLRPAVTQVSYAFEDLRSEVRPVAEMAALSKHSRVPAHYVFEEGREGVQLALAF